MFLFLEGGAVLLEQVTGGRQSENMCYFRIAGQYLGQEVNLQKLELTMRITV